MALNKEYIKQPERMFGWNYLKHYFEYDPGSGRVYHKEIGEDSLPLGSKLGLQHWNKKAGKLADVYDIPDKRTAYRKVKHQSEIGLCYFISHRLAWLLTHKEWPSGEIDHLDGNGLNNNLCNLRDCGNTTHNRRNIYTYQKRKYPRGVRYYLSGAAKTPTFRAYFHGDDGKLKTLYCGRDLFEACCARKSWENEMLKDPSNGYTARHFGRE